MQKTLPSFPKLLVYSFYSIKEFTKQKHFHFKIGFFFLYSFCLKTETLFIACILIKVTREDCSVFRWDLDLSTQKILLSIYYL